MGPNSLRCCLQPDARDVCPPYGETAFVTTREARSSVASGPIYCKDADGAFTLGVSSLGGLAPVLAADAPPRRTLTNPRFAARSAAVRLSAKSG